jgi:maspardin
MILKNFISFFFQGWKIYDSGPKNVKVPLVCVPPVSGTAEVFFKQILALNAKGIRVIAVRTFYTIVKLQ